MAAPSEYAASPDPKEGLFVYPNWAGLRNNVTPEMFAPGDLVTALNVDINDSQDISRRKGYSAVVIAGVDRSLWAYESMCFGVGSNALKWINPDYTTTTLRTGLTAGASVSYAPVGQRVFYANGFELGCVDGGVHRSWGLDIPGLPIATAMGGTLTPGIYQYVMTYLRDDGQESGAGLAGTIELTAMGGIAFSALPVSSDPTVDFKILYLSAPGGETMFRAALLANTDTSVVVDEPRKGASPLMTQFLSPPPAGHYVAQWKGWTLVARGDRLYVSEPYAPELFDLRKSYPFGGRITMLAPLHDKVDTIRKRSGVWIGTDDRVIWLEGWEAPETWSFKPAADYGVIPGAFTSADGELIGDGSLVGNTVVMFASKRGICFGQADGNLVNLTQARYAFPVMDRGAAIVRRHRGMGQFLATLQGTPVAGNVAV